MLHFLLQHHHARPTLLPLLALRASPNTGLALQVHMHPTPHVGPPLLDQHQPEEWDCVLYRTHSHTTKTLQTGCCRASHMRAFPTNADFSHTQIHGHCWWFSISRGCRHILYSANFCLLHFEQLHCRALLKRFAKRDNARAQGICVYRPRLILGFQLESEAEQRHPSARDTRFRRRMQRPGQHTWS